MSPAPKATYGNTVLINVNTWVNDSLVNTLPRPGLSDLTYDKDPRVSRSALVRWSGVGTASPVGAAGARRALGCERSSGALATVGAVPAADRICTAPGVTLGVRAVSARAGMASAIAGRTSVVRSFTSPEPPA